MKPINARSLIFCVSMATLATSAGCVMKQTSGTRDSGQSKLMDETFAGKNACNPEEHSKPFVIEWDATDMSSFESIAANDVVFVKYEGCSLRVLDECKNDSIRGEQGAYKPVEWTTGQLEAIDISNTGELYAKLPLGEATLGARVSGGESFHMEYYVAGTRYASRDAVYAADIEGRYGCDDATHFVYGYNLGAFALGSANGLKIEGGASAYGFGGGGKRESSYQADKKGGDLGACTSDSAQEVSGCKSPIRLNLRKIRPGESPEAEAMKAPDTAESLSAAAVVNQKIEMSQEAQAYIDSATAKNNAGDGKGCLQELKKHDKINAKYKSTNSSSPWAMLRASCVMRSGQCDAGKVQMRKALEKSQGHMVGPEQLDKNVEAMAMMYCEGKMSNRDALLKALKELSDAAYLSAKDSKFCADRYAKVKKLIPKVKPKDEYDTQIANADKGLIGTVPACFARANNCKAAFAAYEEITVKNYEKVPKDQLADIVRNNFESMVPKCKGK